MTEKELRTIVRAVLDEVKPDHIHIDAASHYQDHLFVSYWRATWDRASRQIGALVLAIILAVGVLLVGALIWLIDPKLIGLLK